MASERARVLTCFRRAALGVAGAVGVPLLACHALAQSAPGSVPDGNTTPPPATSSPSNPNYQPGFIDAFGRFIGDSAAKLGDSAAKLNSQLGSKLDSAKETLGEIGNQTSDAAKNAVGAAKDAVGAAKDTAGAIVGLPGERVADGRERCVTAANGGADCNPAAETMCRAKGFSGGRILDTRAEEKCPASVLLSGRLPKQGDCPTETFVTRAFCR